MSKTSAIQADGHAYYYPLDLMRFLAASVVVAFHLSFYAWADQGTSTTARAFQHVGALPGVTPWTWFGFVGVEVFFVISGFVIANSAVGAPSGKFAQNRALRLLPAAWICATITLLVRQAAGPDTGQALLGPYLSSMTLFPVGPWIDGAYWSLAVEIAFYGLIFVLIAAHRLRWLSLLAGALTLWSGAFLALSESGLGKLAPGWRLIDPNADVLLLRHGALFAVGVWLWLFSKRQLGPAGRVALVAAVAIGGLEIWMRGESLQKWEAPVAAGQPLILPVLVWLGAVAAMLAMARHPERFSPKSEAARTLLRRVGLATYPLYLVHNVVGATLMRELVQAGAPMWLALALAVVAVLTLAFLIALLAEPGLRRWLRRRLNGFGQAARLPNIAGRQPAP